jgi:uncharacterized protein YodC (DUF2158 family)
MQFKLGDVVHLKSGGPDMTFSEMREDGYVVTAWFSRKGKLREGVFEPEMLESSTDDESEGFYEDVDADENELSDAELDSLVAQSEYYKHRGN